MYSTNQITWAQSPTVTHTFDNSVSEPRTNGPTNSGDQSHHPLGIPLD